MNPKTSSLLLALCLLALCLLALQLRGQVAVHGPDLANNRGRLPESTGPAVACVVADMDGDGDLDLVRATASTVVIALQDPSGRFIPSAQLLPTTSLAPAPVQAVAVGLLDSDKSPDVLMAHRDGTCRVAVNNGQGKVSGTFSLPALGNVLRPALHSVLVGDLDGAFGDDIVVVLNQLPPQVYLADKNGRFNQPTVLRGPPLLNPASMLVDIDQDRDQDLLVVTGDAKAPAPPYAYLNSSGKFGVATTSFFSNLKIAASQVLAADTNRDGRPEIIFATAGGTAVPRIYTRPSTSKTYQAQANVGKFATSTALTLLAADASGDGFVDLVALQSDGSLVLGINGGTSSPGTFAAPVTLLRTGGRQCLAVGDLEPDEDIDLVVGGTEMEDSLLLGNGRGAFVDTEDRGMPIAKLALSSGALVDATGDGDPDMVLYDRGGKPALLVNDNGQARFKLYQRKALPVALPTLPSGTYTDVQRAAVASTRGVDVLVHGTSVLSAQAGVRILVRTESDERDHYYQDQTSTRWPSQGTYTAMAVGDIGGHTTGSLGVARYSDLVVLSTAGQLLLVLNNKETFSVQKTVIANRVESGSHILVGHVNGAQDQLLDIVVLQPTLGIRVFLGRQKPADTFLESKGLKAAPSEGLLTDLTGDGQVDLLIATRQTLSGLQLFQGTGKGSFSDVSSKLPATGLNVGTVSSLAVLRSATESLPAVVVGLPDGADLLLRRLGTAFATPTKIPYRGSNATERCLAGDLDLDGDDDLVTLRATVFPGVLLGQSLQVTQNSMTQVGRSLTLSTRLPNTNASGVVAVWPQSTRVALPGVGILRIPWMIPVRKLAKPATTLTLTTPPRLALVPIPLQLFVMDGPVFRIGNLDVLELTAH